MSDDAQALSKYKAKVRHPAHNQRRGQYAFNTLVEMRPDLAEKIRGGSHDPYYWDDERSIEPFLMWVGENW